MNVGGLVASMSLQSLCLRYLSALGLKYRISEPSGGGTWAFWVNLWSSVFGKSPP